MKHDDLRGAGRHFAVIVGSPKGLVRSFHGVILFFDLAIGRSDRVVLWPKAMFTVAWGERSDAPGNPNEKMGTLKARFTLFVESVYRHEMATPPATTYGIRRVASPARG
jgi:hypothetical protein